MRTLGDKYPEHTVSKEHHDTTVSKKDEELRTKDAQIVEDNKNIIALTKRVTTLTEAQDKAKANERAFGIKLNQQIKLAGEAQKQAGELTKKLRDKEVEFQEQAKALLTEKTKTRDAESKVAQQKLQFDALKSEKETIEGELKREQEKVSALEEEKKQAEEKKAELEKKVEDYDKIKEELEETKKSLEAVREIEKSKEGADGDRWATMALSGILSSVAVKVLDRDLDDDIWGTAVYYGSGDFCIGIYQDSGASFTLGGVNGASGRGYFGSNGDLRTVGKFNSDSYRNQYGRKFLNEGGSVKGKRETFMNLAGDEKYSYAVYIGDGKVMNHSIRKYPFPALNQTYSNLKDSTNVTQQMLAYSVGGNPSTKSGKTGEPTEGQKKITTYGQYLDFLGLKGDPEKKLVVPKSLLS